MGKVEVLQQVKDAEESVRRRRAEAEAERERIIKDSRTRALEAEEQLRREAEERYRQVIARADEAARAEREAILAGGRQEADKIRAAAERHLEEAVALLLKRFEASVHGPS